MSDSNLKKQVFTADEASARGAAAYTNTALSIYDLFVLGFSNTFAWKCTSRTILDFYNRHVSDRHLDVGVGTGYFLDKCSFASSAPAITLMDLNGNSLRVTAKRLERYKPSCIQADELRPLEARKNNFNSIGLNYLLHCLPGDLKSKSAVFDNLKGLLADRGAIFGSTILGQGVRPNLLARTLSDIYNKKGIFSNRSDRLEDLDAGLRRHFSDVEIRLVGCVALFYGRKM